MNRSLLLLSLVTLIGIPVLSKIPSEEAAQNSDPSAISPYEQTLIQNALGDAPLALQGSGSAGEPAQTSSNTPLQTIQVTPEEMKELSEGKVTLNQILAPKESTEDPAKTRESRASIEDNSVSTGATRHSFPPPQASLDTEYSSIARSESGPAEEQSSASKRVNESMPPGISSHPSGPSSGQAIAITERDLELLQGGRVTIQELIRSRELVDLGSENLPSNTRIISPQSLRLPQESKTQVTLLAPSEVSIRPVKAISVSVGSSQGKVFNRPLAGTPLPHGYLVRRYLPPATTATSSPQMPGVVPISALNNLSAAPYISPPLKHEQASLSHSPGASASIDTRGLTKSDAPYYRGLSGAAQPFRPPSYDRPSGYYYSHPPVISAYDTGWIRRSPIFMTQSPSGGLIPIFSPHGPAKYIPGSPLAWPADTLNTAN